MNIIVRKTLLQIVDKYGREISDDAKRCENLLNDLCGDYRREINVLVKAIDERVPLDLLAGAAAMPFEMLLNRLEKRLEEQTAMTAEAARWAVESWALALSLATELEIEKRNATVVSAQNAQPAKPLPPAGNHSPKPPRTIPAAPKPPIFVPQPKTNSPVVRQPSQTAPPAHSPTISQAPAPPVSKSLPNISKIRFGVFRGCLILFFLLAVASVVLLFGVPYAIEVMRETQRERNNEPPRFPVR